jgi:hypothetical protein
MRVDVTAAYECYPTLLAYHGYANYCKIKKMF